MKALTVEEPVKVKSKNLNVLAEYEKSNQKKAANFVVIGKTMILWLDSRVFIY
jgi:elongation factor 1 alpha-like protein